MLWWAACCERQYSWSKTLSNLCLQWPAGFQGCVSVDVPKTDWDSPQWKIRSNPISVKSQFNLHRADHSGLDNTIQKAN